MKAPFSMEVVDAIIKDYGQQNVPRDYVHNWCHKHDTHIPPVSMRPFIGQSAGLARGVHALGQWRSGGEVMSAGVGNAMQLHQPNHMASVHVMPPVIMEDPLSDEELLESINARFAALDLCTYAVIDKSFRSMIVSGNAGIGKTFTLEYILESSQEKDLCQFTHIRGFVRATGLFKLLYEHKEKNQILLLDDADSIFGDEVALNLLKGALDTSKKRTISWRSEKVFETEGGEPIPQSFDFNGAVIFVTNINFQRQIAMHNKMAPHLAALASRSFYLDLNLTDQRELMIRIKSVIELSGILEDMGGRLATAKKKSAAQIIEYLETNVARMRELSLRTVVKLGQIFLATQGDPINFKKMADATLLVRR